MGGEPISVARARELVLERCRPVGSGEVAVEEALGRVLAATVNAAGDVPGSDNSAMDGIAALPVPGGTELRVVGESRAGSPFRGAPGKGEAIRISTGAVVPPGPLGVLPVELLDDRGATVVTGEDLGEGRNVRRAGEDIRAGQPVLEPGRRLGPAELGMAVAAGLATVPCYRRPRVAIVATGDELRAPGEPLGPGQIHNSNLVTISALAEQDGCEVVGVTRAADSLEACREALEAALGQADVVACSGGVSVGSHDHVREALAGLGAEEVFWRVALRPGKPTWFGTHGEALVFGLPGNPVSAMVTWILFARPAVAALQGLAPPEPASGRLGEPVARNPGRDECVRVRIEGGLAYPTGPQGSHVLSSMALADGLALVPRGEGELSAGDEVELLAISP